MMKIKTTVENLNFHLGAYTENKQNYNMLVNICLTLILATLLEQLSFKSEVLTYKTTLDLEHFYLISLFLLYLII